MSEHDQGPAMICATPIMRTGPTRIGQLGSIKLPRTIPIVTLFACGLGGFLGIALAMFVSSGIQAFTYGAVFGGGAGWFLVTYSPLQGESMLKWFELQFHATRRGRYIDGERVTLAVGTARLPRAPRGRVRLVRSAVRIPSSQYDSRGVLISPKNQNLPTDGQIDPLLFAALSLPGEGAMSMTPVNDKALAGAPAREGDRRAPRRATPAPAAPAGDPFTAKPQRLRD